MESTSLLLYQLCQLIALFLLAFEISLAASCDSLSVKSFSLKLTISLTEVFRFSLVRSFENLDPKEDFLSWILELGCRCSHEVLLDTIGLTCHAGVISIIIAKEYLLRFFQKCWKTSVPLLNRPDFHAMHTGTWREIPEAKRSIFGDQKTLKIF